MKKNQNFELHAGDSLVLTFIVKDEDHELVDLTDTTIDWALAESPKAATTLVNKSGVVTGAGTFTVTLNVDDTIDLTPKRYYHEAQVTTINNTKHTVAIGEITILPALIS